VAFRRLGPFRWTPFCAVPPSATGPDSRPPYRGSSPTSTSSHVTPPRWAPRGAAACFPASRRSTVAPSSDRRTPRSAPAPSAYGECGNIATEICFDYKVRELHTRREEQRRMGIRRKRETGDRLQEEQDETDRESGKETGDTEICFLKDCRMYSLSKDTV
jgi:hypothetical protein